MSAAIRLSVRLSEKRIAACVKALGVSRTAAISKLRHAYEIAFAHGLDGRALMATADGHLRWEPEEQVAFAERRGDKCVEEVSS